MSTIVVNIPGARILSSSGSGSNGRQHWAAKSREVKQHRHGAFVKTMQSLTREVRGYAAELLMRGGARAVAYGGKLEPGGPLYPARRVTLTRIHPAGRAIRDEDDNLRAAFKGTKDGVADALGLDDASRNQGGSIEWMYNQIVGPWGIRITIES